MNVQYQFWVYNAATQTWSQLQAFSTSAACLWTPNTAGNYYLSTTALDSSTGTEKSATTWYTITPPPLSAVTLTTSPASTCAINTSVTLTATPTGGTNVQFQFWVYSAATQTWSKLQGYSASTAVSGRQLPRAVTTSPLPRKTATPAKW